MRKYVALGLTSLAIGLLTSASAIAQQAVSQPNAKIEAEGGSYINPTASQYAVGASFAAPLSDTLGLQVDAAAHNRTNAATSGAAIHLFTRDPDAYLAGAAAGYVTTNAANLFAVGPEIEFYADKLTIEAWAGWANMDYTSALRTDKNGFFVLADIAFYATDNTRISVGGGTILDTETVKLAIEHAFEETPVPFSLTGKIAWDEGFGTRATIGFKSYFGENDKSLIARHRQDDPRNLGLDMFIGGLPAEAEPEEEVEEVEEDMDV